MRVSLLRDVAVGEGTYECRHESPCPACQMRHLRTDLAAEKERAERAEHKYADAHAVYRKTRLHMGEELRTLAAAVKTSGVVCPVCGGGQLPPLESRCRCGGLYDIVAVIGTGEVKHIWRCRNCNTVAPKNVCPRCSVEMGEVVKCWECRGTRTVREWDRSTGYSENVSCSYCHGLGKHISIRGDGTVYLRTVALGLVYDEGVIGGGVTQQVTGRHTEESLVTVDDTTGNQPTKEDRRKMEGFWDKAKGQLGQ